MASENGTIAILPRQYVARYKNTDTGEMLRIVQFVEEAGLELKKLFIPVQNFKELGVQSMLGNKVNMLLDEDDEGRPYLVGISVLKK